MTKHIKAISITALDLDMKNPRFENQTVRSQREAIQKLLEIKGMAGKIAAMAEHIGQHGIDPTELPLVIVSPNNKNKYISLEGNRRVLAIKLLHNPGLCPTSQSGLQKKIAGVLKETDSIQNQIQCSVVANRKEANLWIDLKHTGENNGVGRVTWDGRATDAFREKTIGRKSTGRLILEYIKDDSKFDSELRTHAEAIKITNLQRLFNALETKECLGYKIRDGVLHLCVPLEKFRGSVESIVHRFYEDGISVSDIYDKSKRKRFLANRISSVELPKESDFSMEYSSLSDAQIYEASNSSKESKTKKTKAKQPSNLRKHLINYSLRITHVRINAIYHELKSKIDVHEAPNAGAVLLRVLLELTADYALKELSLDSKKSVKNGSLRKKITVVTDKLSTLGKLTSKETKDIKISADDKTNLYCSIDSLHRYIHGQNHPVSKQLNDVADNWAPFLKAVWSYSEYIGN